MSGPQLDRLAAVAGILAAWVVVVTVCAALL
ncbi:hypothetical+protein [Methylocapsa aurea]